MKPEDVVDAQLNFYNNHDLEQFCQTYTNDIEIFDFYTGAVILSGQKALREKYKYRFEVQKVNARVTRRIVIGNKVIDHEEVTGISEDGIVRAVAIYEICNDLISKVHFIFE